MKRNFLQMAGLASTLFLIFFTLQLNAQTASSGVVVRVVIDGVATDYYAGNCGYGTADWGGSFTDNMCGSPAWAHDITPDSLACDSIPAGQLTGKVALIRRGVCGFSVKALNAQKAGAVAVMIAQTVNTTTDDCYVQNIGATQPQAGLTTIPCIFICRAMANQITAGFAAHKSVQVCFVKPDISISSAFYPASHVKTPVSQIAMDTFGFSVKLTNPSATVSRTNVVATAKVLQADGTQLFTSSVTIPEILPGVVDTPYVIPGLFAPELPVGTYSIKYNVVSDPVAGVAPVQDNKTNNFYVTTDEFANDDAPTIGYRPSTAGDWAVGALYTMKPGLDHYKATKAEFAFATNATDYPLDSVTTTFYLFRVHDDVLADYSNFSTADFLSASMDWVGLASYHAPTGTVANSLQSSALSDFLTGADGVQLDNGARYVIAAQYSAPTDLTFSAFSQAVDLPGVSTLIYQNQWFLGGFGAGIESVLHLYIELVTKTDDVPLPATAMQIVPNPVQDNLNLAVKFDQPTDATITIADINGRVITNQNREGLLNETLHFPLHVAAGTYLARIATKNGTLTKEFVVVH
jgi:hypothetical protein